MHGMAGSAALILLSLEAVQSFPMGILYIVLFGAGSIVGMALLSIAIAIPLRVRPAGRSGCTADSPRRSGHSASPWGYG